MPLTVSWDEGVSVKHGATRILFDPKNNIHSHPTAFITHAHFDHSQGFGFPEPQKFSTKETCDLLKVYGKEARQWKPMAYAQRVKIDDIEVVAHNAGHVLGSALYEVVSPEGNLVYTGDFQFRDTFTMKAAEVVPCDILVLEATFGLPSFVFPQRDVVTMQMVQWAVESVKKGEIPTLKTDPLGNAQEIIHAFNMLTTLPVTIHRRVAQISKVYEAYGHSLEFLDASSEEASEITSSGECVFIAPKGLNLTKHLKFNVALASGWALWAKSGSKAFALSDHADFTQLMEFVEGCKPKTVLTCFGGRFNKTFAHQVEKHFGIEARPLGLIPTTLV